MTLSVPLPVPQGHIILAVSLVHAAKGLWQVGVVNKIIVQLQVAMAVIAIPIQFLTQPQTCTAMSDLGQSLGSPPDSHTSAN